MSARVDRFVSDLFASDEQRFDGARLLFTRAGAEITTTDLVSVAEAHGGLSLEELSQLSLVLDLEARVVRRSLGDLTLRAPLFAFEDPAGTVWLFMPGSDGMLSCVDLEGAEAPRWPEPGVVGRALIFDEIPGRDRGNAAESIMRTILRWKRKPLLAVVGISFASNVLGLTLPLFTLAVYDQVLAAGEARMLSMLVVGLVLGLAADAVLRAMRARIISDSAAYFDVRLASRVFSSLLRDFDGGRLSTDGMLSARLRDLDRIANFVFGTVGISLIEAPFALIYVLLLFLLMGWSALAPIAFLVVGFTVVVGLSWSASRRGRRALGRADEYGALCTEISERLGSIRIEGAQGAYEARFRDASARLAEAELLQQRTGQIVQLASGVLVSLTVLLTLTVGALASIGGDLSVGALIASVALVWRMSVPVPALLQARIGWPDMRNALTNAGEILRTSIKELTAGGGGGGRAMSGRITFSSVNFTYGRGHTAALRNLSFETGPGEIVAITGHSGAGKSTLLDLLSGLLKPQFGSVTIDGINPQQVSSSDLRQSIGYLARDGAAMPFSVREFLRLGVDPAERDDVNEICERLGLASAIAALPRGFETPMTEIYEDSGLAQGLSLARVLAAKASLLLLDEPDAASRSVRAALIAELDRLRGQSTVLLVTHEPSFIEVADRVLILKDGMLVRDCTPREIARRKLA